MSLVGYDNKTVRSRLTPRDHSTACSLSGAVTRFFCQPLGVTKIRLHIQVGSGAESKYLGPLHLVYTMLREEGLKSLWKGHIPAQVLSITYCAANFLALLNLLKGKV
jgi:solute carrier family 25 thiamine pyrophosphate transporter 19